MEWKKAGRDSLICLLRSCLRQAGGMTGGCFAADGRTMKIKRPGFEMRTWRTRPITAEGDEMKIVRSIKSP